jgi:hypothetical protein
MEFRGKIKEVTKDILTGRLNITFESASDTSILNEMNALKEMDDLTIKVSKWRRKRSTDANALLWKCLDDIAKAMNPPCDKWDVYLLMLKRYGKFTYIVVKENAVEAMKLQWRECEVVGDYEVNGQKAVQMLCYFGSSVYDVSEFSKLLDGVISEMKEMGLPTPTSEEMKQSLKMWEEKCKA